MNTLHIVRHDAKTVSHPLIAAYTCCQSGTTVDLDSDQVDYDALIDLIFSHDRVICWW